MMDENAVAEVHARLGVIQKEHGVRIPLAVESGSRAWGFPSPDSDYDGRFIFVRSVDAYLSLTMPRDVIETPLTALIDVNGWDLAKALKLLLKGNAVVIEWLTSPVAYLMDEGFRSDLRELAARTADQNAVIRHYHHLAINQRGLLDETAEGVKLKKVFYVLRPLVAIRWLSQRPGVAVAPMHFPTLCDEADLTTDVRGAIDDMIARKQAVREMGRGRLPQAIRRFMDDAMETTPKVAAQRSCTAVEALAMADEFFRRVVMTRAS